MSKYHVANLRPMPGSFEAVAQGCQCPREQPRAFQGVYWMTESCRLHGKQRAEPLTAKQAQVYRFLVEHIEANGCAPSFDEIASKFGYHSLATVHEHLSNLATKGWITRAYNESRAITCLVPLSSRSSTSGETGR